MTQQEALNVLVSAVRLANKRGAFEIEESSAVFEAVKVFTPNQEEVNLTGAEVPQEETTQEG